MTKWTGMVSRLSVKPQKAPNLIPAKARNGLMGNPKIGSRPISRRNVPGWISWRKKEYNDFIGC
jgi:hypothetical protein